MALWIPPEARSAINEQPKHGLGNQLQAVDEGLILMRWDLPSIPGQFKNGWYYIVRFCEDGSIAAWEVHNNDQWCEPSQAHVDVFRRGDTWTNPDEFKRRQKRHDYERDMARRRAQDEALWQFQDKAAFAFRTQIPVPRKVA